MRSATARTLGWPDIQRPIAGANGRYACIVAELSNWKANPLTQNIRSLEIMLNRALKTGDVAVFCAAIDEAIRNQPNVKQLASKAGLDRTSLYRLSRSDDGGPNIETVIKILGALGFRFMAEFKGRSPTSHSRHTCDQLTRAFKAGATSPITEVFSDALRAQENVSDFAKKTSLNRTGLYRAFRAPRKPRFRTVLDFLNALNLRLAVTAR